MTEHRAAPRERQGRPHARRMRLERDLAAAEREAFLAEPGLAEAFERESAVFQAAAARIAEAHDGARIVAQIAEKERAYGARLGTAGIVWVSLALVLPGAAALALLAAAGVPALRTVLVVAASLAAFAGAAAVCATVATVRGGRSLGIPGWVCAAAAALLAAAGAAAWAVAPDGWGRVVWSAIAGLAAVATIVFAAVDRGARARSRRRLAEETGDLRAALDALDRALDEARRAAVQGLAVDGDGTALRAVVEERSRRLDALRDAGRISAAERLRLEAAPPGSLCLSELLGEVLEAGAGT